MITEDILITSKDLMKWLNREITEDDEELCMYLSNAVKNQYEYHKEIERLNNIIKPKEVNYNYLKLLFEKEDKEEVIKSYVYKCEQLEKLYKSYEEKEIEVMKKDNIINELEEYLIEQFNKTQDVKYCDDLIKLKELKGE